MEDEPASTVHEGMTSALEDYLETIYVLVRDGGYARVRDIAKARSVKAGSVSPALKRLAELGLVDYERREYVRPTAAGETQARRVLSRHRLLARFFGSVLGMPAEAAEKEACAIEHSLSDAGMERLVRLFEYLSVCPDAGGFLDGFRACSAVHPDAPPCGRESPACTSGGTDVTARSSTLADLSPGERGRVSMVEGRGAIRRRLLDMGILPQAVVDVQRRGPGGEPVWVKIQGAQIALRQAEARAVVVTRIPAE